jgi:hypothetical protein
MARQALKSLSRQRLMYADIPDFFELLKTETERMGAILAAAGVEDGLEYAIENQFQAQRSLRVRASASPIWGGFN